MEFIVYGGLGDQIAATAVVRKYKRAFPGENVRIWEPRTRDVWRLNRHLNHGNGENGQRVGINLGVLGDAPGTDHAVDIMARSLGVSAGDRTPEIILSDSERVFERAGHRRIAFDPWAIAAGHWPIEKWNEVTRVLGLEYEVVEIGGGRPAGIGPVCSKSYYTRLNVRELAALLETCNLYMGHDSAMFHLAAAVGTPQVVVFGSVPSYRRKYDTTIALDGLEKTSAETLLTEVHRVLESSR